ncbi:MAG: WYL domain-containing protein [Actinomycetota bacterium]|nr:MAG: WYL domain-containing protein [Actinomycetota bacterium]
MSAPRTERLLNLLFCLMASSQPMSRAEVRASLVDYRESPSAEAFERMFERDKDELRSMGVPVETVTTSAGEVEGYRIARDDYALPDLTVTPAEYSVLGLAAQVWEQASLGPAATSALRKLEAAGGGVATVGELGVRSRVAAPDPAFLPLLDAVRRRTPVTFEYRRPDQSAGERRRVQPWGVASRRGRWYVVGHDLARDATRAFRLSRVYGEVTVDGPAGSYEIPADIDVPALLTRSFEPDAPVAGQARIQLRHSAGHALRIRAAALETGPEHDVVTVDYRDEEQIAAAVAEVGAAAIVLDPPEVRAAVLRRLRAVAGA